MKTEEKLRPPVAIDFSEPDFKSPEDRKSYVAQVAGFYKDILKDVLYKKISETERELAGVHNTRDVDLILKGTINALWLINDWGEQMLNERVSHLQEGREEITN